MARAVICLGVFAVGLCLAAPASAQQQNGGYIAVSKLQIDPHMNMLNDGVDPKAPPLRSMPMIQGGGDGLPPAMLQDEDAPIGDDPVSDNAVQTDVVYTA